MEVSNLEASWFDRGVLQHLLDDVEREGLERAEQIIADAVDDEGRPFTDVTDLAVHRQSARRSNGRHLPVRRQHGSSLTFHQPGELLFSDPARKPVAAAQVASANHSPRCWDSDCRKSDHPIFRTGAVRRKRFRRCRNSGPCC